MYLNVSDWTGLLDPPTAAFNGGFSSFFVHMLKKLFDSGTLTLSS